MPRPAARQAHREFDPPSKGRQHALLAWLALGYGVLIIYGSLFPLGDWQTPATARLAFLLPPYEGRPIYTDILLNILVYMPLGLLLALRLRPRFGFARAVLTATLLGGLLSLAMEALQMSLPGRVSSVTDLATNAGGSLLGALLAAFLGSGARLGRWPAAWRAAWLLPGRGTDLVLLTTGLWILSQLSPLAPSLDIGNLRQGLAPLAQVLRGAIGFDRAAALTYALYLTGLGVLALRVIRPERSRLLLYLAFVTLVLLLKVPVVGRQLSLEALTGLALAALLLPLLDRLSTSRALLAGTTLLAGGYLATALTPAADAGALYYPFNWIPLKGHMPSIMGLANILSSLWPYAAAGTLLRLMLPRSRQWHAALGGGLLVLLLTFGVEWLQQSLPGRYPDFTDVLLALVGWSLPWWLLPPVARPMQQEMARPPAPAWPTLVMAVAACLLLAEIAAWSMAQNPSSALPPPGKPPALPDPQALPAPDLPGFVQAHPRLPAPGPQDIARLQAENPRYLAGVMKRAGGGGGALETVVLAAWIEPGSQDLDLLHRRLMELRFTGRGDSQGKALALGYDWLHAQWSPAQRESLRVKLAEAGDYLIGFIRKARLSPYNVYLYNSPLQALMAVAIALYQDDVRGDPIMAFTQDLWLQRVLPVWRQVMGANGGWHEGGEYVGIGIGQAVYQLPAMWRAATGEDLFATEPGLRGFLDFLVYRTRPDGSHFRWGDGGHFNRTVPDRIPLALEYRHAAAYSLDPPRDTSPGAWPWGPLPDPSLEDPGAIARLPLSRFFDGLGLLVSRSDWSEQATYLTFKTGPNYWSHVHLDQGAFTIFKGGPLAIDSGLYGPTYGSDHHMNYSYQTIAHNSITVTDPADTLPGPARRKEKEPRAIANDGGQRRVGSGWGEEPAPIDLMEWETKRHLYDTGRVLRRLEEDGLNVALADVTPAYTNHRSGTGTFADRTRRVERFWRTFIHDRLDDVIVIFDQVSATDPAFRKRWLLHSLEQPRMREDGFSIRVPPNEERGWSGGRLEGRVLLPRRALLQTLGGPDFEYFVEARNYDEDGTLWEQIRARQQQQLEPGAWRIELQPMRPARDDLFLVVLLPTGGEAPAHRVRLLEAGGRVGAEINGPRRTSRWWFEPEQLGVAIEIEDGDGTRHHQVVADPVQAAAPFRARER
ncbi:MAG: VanZ family protein [Gammaproteobacteria bacterium]